jgi:hypothetical protein
MHGSNNNIRLDDPLRHWRKGQNQAKIQAVSFMSALASMYTFRGRPIFRRLICSYLCI